MLLRQLLRPGWKGCIGGLLFFLTACGQRDAPQAVLADYLERVNYVLEWDGADPQAYKATVLPYPRRRDLRLEQADLRIGLLDFVALKKCGLQELVGQRNSGLGKVMEPSKRLLYEHQLLKGLRHCRDQLVDGTLDDAELLAQLENVLAVKEQELPKAFWNATFGGPEFEILFSRSAGPLPLNGVHLETSQAALGYLSSLSRQLGQAELSLESAALEEQLFALQAGRDGGRLVQSMDLLHFYLDRTARTLEERLAQRPVCFGAKASPKGKILRTVFDKFYVGRIQLYMAQIHRQGKTWLEANKALVQAQGVLPPAAFTGFYTAQLDMEVDTGAWRRFDGAIQRHTAAWQALMEQCGMRPGGL